MYQKTTKTRNFVLKTINFAEKHTILPFQVNFQWKNPDFLLKIVDFLLKNDDFLLKTVDFTIKQDISKRKKKLQPGEKQTIAVALFGRHTTHSGRSRVCLCVLLETC